MLGTQGSAVRAARGCIGWALLGVSVPLSLSLDGACPHACSPLDLRAQTHSETCDSSLPILMLLVVSIFDLALLPADPPRPSDSLVLCLAMPGLLLNL